MSFVKTEEEIEKMRRAGAIWSIVMREIKAKVKPGLSLKELDEFAEKRIREEGGTPGFLNYKPEWNGTPYPATLCTSVNEIIVHGIPNDYRLKEGDLLKVDMGVVIEGYNVDAARTIPVGKVDKEALEISAATELALEKGMAAAKAGNTIGDIGHAVQEVAKEHNLHIAEGLSGHGIGAKLHEKPSVYNTGNPGEGERLEAGMCLAIEPMFAKSTGKIQHDHETDGYAMQDGSQSAHFENTVVITDGEVEILTKD